MAGRPLPRSLAPHPEESLPGYLLNLGARLNDSPGRLAVRLGLSAPDALGSARVAASHAVRLPDGAAAEMARVARLTPREVTRLTLARWDGLLLTDAANGASARTEHGRAWTVPAATRSCPECLPRADGPVDDDGQPAHALWKASWRTPWAFACVRHSRLLLDRCPSCTTLLGLSRGDRRLGLLPARTVDWLHPAACRARTADGSKGDLCGYRLDQHREPFPATPWVLEAQARLDGLLDGTAGQMASLGADVTGAQWLHDIRLLAVALRIVPLDAWPLPAPAGLELEVRNDQQDRSDRRADDKRTGARDDRTWTEPPSAASVGAAIVATAIRLLDADHDTVRGLLTPTVAAASAAEPLLWARIRNGGAPSPRLARWTSPGHGGTFSAHVLAQAAAGTALTAGADQVPQWATPEQDLLVAALAPGASERDRRRATSLAVVRLLDGADLQSAAASLGIPKVSAESAVARTGRALRRAGTDDAYRHAVAGIAAGLTAASTSYGDLRRRFGPQPWTLPDAEWQRIRDEMTALRLGRRDTDWDSRRVACAIWLWARLTSGDPALSPLAAGTSPTGRSCTSGRLGDVSEIDRSERMTDYLHTVHARLAQPAAARFA